MIDKKTKALQKLMPLGGWSYDGNNIIIHPDGEAHGYTAPSQEQINAEIVTIEHNEPILDELKELDAYVPRYVEDLLIEANKDSFLVGKANKKKSLRAKLK